MVGPLGGDSSPPGYTIGARKDSVFLAGPARTTASRPFSADAGGGHALPAEQFLVPRRGLGGPAGQGGAAPDERKGARGLGRGLGPLGVLDRVGTGPVRVEQAEQPAQVDALASRVEDVGSARW